MAKKEAFLQFLKAARSLQDRGLSKEAIVQFAKNEFGELSELFKKQIDSLFKPKKGIENIKLKDEVFDDTVIKLPIDDTGVPFNPNDPLKQYGKTKNAETAANNRMLDEDEIAELDMDIGGLEYTNDFDGTLGSANKLRKEHKQYIADMELEYKKGNLDPKPGEANRERFLQKKFDEMEASGDNRLMTREEIEELSSFSLQKDMDKSIKKFKEKDAKQKKIIKDFDPGDRDPSAEGGIIGYYTGGMVDVEPNLSDIGHGSDALMARTRLVSPDGQATTSTGLNYLLAEDNDNIRVPFGSGGSYDYGSMQHKINSVNAAYKRYLNMRKGKQKYKVIPFEIFSEEFAKENFAEGGRIGFSKGRLAKEVADKGRRGFMKAAGAVGAGIAALKTGLLGFGKGATKQVAEELTSVPIGNPEGMPAWFKPLVNKIIKEGDEVTKKFGTVDREIVHTKKIDDFEEVTVYQDLNTGNVRMEYGPHLTDDTGKVIRASNEPTVVQLEYKAPEMIEPNITTGKGGGKTKEEFYAAESEPEIVNWDGDIEMSGINEVNKVEDLITDTSKLQKYATDNKLTIKELSDSMKKQKYKNKLDSDLGEQVNYIENKSGMNAMDYIDEGTRVGDFDPKGINLPEKKADGGRIGYVKGKLVVEGGRKFLEKVFGKERFETMIDNDPRMEQGMLEVVDMFRKKDKEGLKMYLQKFMPDMGDAEIEKFIVGDSGTEGIAGQLIRLGSGREYENLIKMSKEADQIRKLDDFDIDGVSKNAEGGRIGLFLGGPLVKNQLTQGKSLFKNMLKFLSKDGSHKKSPAELLQMYNPKQFNKLLNNPMNTGKISPATGETADQIIKNTMSQTQNERAVMVGDIIESARKIKGTDDDIIAYKIKIIKDMIAGGIDEKTARSFAEQMGEQMVRAAGKKVTPKITDEGLLELENIQKNLITKDRKLQATGGLTTMLGE